METYQEEAFERVLRDLTTLVATLPLDDLADALQQDFATPDGGAATACTIFTRAISRALGRANMVPLLPEDNFRE